jgi:hypothetical protein
MEIRSFTPHLILIGLMIITALALAFTVDVTLNDQPGVRMELPKTLDSGWVGDELRYSHNPENPQQYRVSELELPNVDPETGEKLYTMSLVEYDVLPHDTEFIKSIYTNDASSQVFVSIVLSGKERNSIHRPQRCLVGQGHTITASKTMKVPLPGRDPIKIEVLEAVRNYKTPEGENKAYLSYYAYWFVGQHRETNSHYERMFWLAWDRVVHSVAHRWAYIAVSGRREMDSDSYKQEITEFVQELYPHLLVEQPVPDEG